MQWWERLSKQDMVKELTSGYLATSHQSQVGGVLLAVHHAHVVCFAKSHQCSQSDFGAIGDQAEHGFTKHSMPYADAVETSTELPIDPSLHAVGKTGGMQGLVSADHVRHDPCAVLPGSRRIRAMLNDRIKSGVDTDLPMCMRLHPLPQRAVEAEMRDL